MAFIDAEGSLKDPEGMRLWGYLGAAGLQSVEGHASSPTPSPEAREARKRARREFYKRDVGPGTGIWQRGFPHPLLILRERVHPIAGDRHPVGAYRIWVHDALSEDQVKDVLGRLQSVLIERGRGKGLSLPPDDTDFVEEWELKNLERVEAPPYGSGEPGWVLWGSVQRRNKMVTKAELKWLQKWTFVLVGFLVVTFGIAKALALFPVPALLISFLGVLLAMSDRALRTSRRSFRIVPMNTDLPAFSVDPTMSRQLGWEVWKDGEAVVKVDREGESGPDGWNTHRVWAREGLSSIDVRAALLGAWERV